MNPLAHHLRKGACNHYDQSERLFLYKKIAVSHDTATKPRNANNMKKDSVPSINSESPESVNSRGRRLEDDPEAVLRLVDLIFFYIDERPTIYS